MAGILAGLAAGGFLLYLYFGAGPARFSGPTGDSSVLLITIDTLRADHLGAYGDRDVRTPFIDTLADEGVLFENAITPAIMTLPSHASILTGTWPPTHGIRNNGDYRLSPGALTLAEVLRARGLRTGAVVGSFVLDSMFGLDQGFESYDDALPARSSNQTFFAERPAGAVTDAALRYLGSVRPARFFLWVHFFDPHHPYTAPTSWREQYPRSGYDAEIAYVDSEIGRLLAGMKEMGIRDKTLVVLAADHGEGLGDHGEESHGVLPYEEETRVPLIFSLAPHLPAGRRVKGVVRTVDIMPTILELLRIDPEGAAAPVQGTPLWRLMADAKGTMPGLPAYAEAMAPLLLYGWSPLTVVRDDRYKYIEGPRPELFDLVADPREKNDLYAARADLAAQYKTKLESLRREVTREGAGAETIAPDPETEARLRSLGYATGGGARPPDSGAGALPDPRQMVPALEKINRVYAAFGSGQYDAAAAEAREILAEHPENRSVRFYLAGALMETGRHAEAAQEYRKILDASPKDTEAMSNLGWCLTNMQRFDEATETFQRVLEFFPDHIYAKASLANIAFIKGDYREASRLYKEVLRIEPNHMPSIKTMAKMFEETGKLDEAAVFWEHATDVDPGNVDVWMSLGWVRFQQGRNDDALAVLDRAKELAPDAPELLAAAGDVRLAMGKIEEARADYQRAIHLAPRLAAGYYGLGIIEGKLGDPFKALDLVARAVLLNPDKVEWRVDLAHALVRIGRYGAAATELQKYLASGQVPPEQTEKLRQEIEKYRRQRG
ncbi:MAG TPA: sulfatase-like hydrolase/transferase [Candidatus Polarisedimenticolia bacterium]|jgi:arylsulfatase A-like enzyme/Tfp pilus assembly protein PilF